MLKGSAESIEGI